jgi:copper chaperone CopZ
MVAALALLLCLALAACGEQQRVVPASCTTGAKVIERALAKAPGAVRLPDGTALSACVTAADTDAELQTMGLVFTTVADSLAERAQRGDAEAAMRLGYLAGAVRRGAEHTAGVALELERRISRAGAYVAADGGHEAGAALRRGLAAGRATG